MNKNLYIKILIIILIMLSYSLIFTNSSVFAGFQDEGSQNEDFLPTGVVQVSKYTTDYINPEISGYYQINNPFSDKNGDTINKVIRFYKASNVRESITNDKLIDSKNIYTLYLYSLTNNKFDEEIAKVVDERKKLIDSKKYSSLKTIPGFYDGEKMTFFPDSEFAYTFENLIMWAVSSNGDYYIKDLHSKAGREKVLAHNSNDFSEISKGDNFWLGSLIPSNNVSYGVSYVNSGFNLSVEYPSNSEAITILSDISKKFYGNKTSFSATGNYFNTKYGVNKSGKSYNGNYYSVAQDYFKHITLRYDQVNKKTIDFNTAKKNSKEMKNTAKGFTDQSYMFLYDEKSKTFNLPRMHWSAGTYGSSVSEFCSFPRSLNSTSDGSFDASKGNFKEIYSASTSNLRNADFKAWLKNAKLEGLEPFLNDMVFESLNGSFGNLDLYHKVPANCISSCYDLFATYDGLYNYISNKALNDATFKNHKNKNVKNLYKVLTDLNTAGRFAQYVSTYNNELNEDKRADMLNNINSVLKILTIYMSRNFIMDTPSTTLFGTTTMYCRTSSNGYRSFISSKITLKDPPKISTANINTKNIYIAENGTGYNNYVIVNLQKTLNIPDEAYSKFISNWVEKAKTLTNKNSTNKNKTSSQIYAMIDYVGDDIEYFKDNKRTGILLGKAMKGENIGIYLNDSEIQKGHILINKDKTGFEMLKPNTPYVMVSNLRQRTGVNYKDTPSLLKKTYGNIIEEGASINSKSEAEQAKYYEQVKNYFNEGIVFLFNEQVDVFESDLRMQFVMITNNLEGYSKGAFTDKLSWYDLDEEVKSKNSKFYDLISDTKTRSTYYNELFLNNYINDNNFEKNLTPKYGAVANGNRVSGLIPTTYSKDVVSGYQYYEMSEVSPSGSSKIALNRMITQNSKENNVNMVYNIDKYKSERFKQFDGDLYTIDGSFSKNIIDLLGYIRFASGQRDGVLNANDGIKFMTTFVIPEYTVSGKESNIKAYNMLGNPIKTQYKALTGEEVGETKTLTSSGSASSITNKTKGVKFISKLSTNNGGHYERDVFQAFKDKDRYPDLKLIYDIIAKYYYKFENVNRIIVEITSSQKNKKYTIEGSELKFYLTQEEADILDASVIDFMIEGLRKTPYEPMYFSMLEVYNDNLKANGSATNAYINKVERFLNTLEPAQLLSLLFQSIIDNKNTTDDVFFMNYEVETGVEDMLVSNNINSQAEAGGSKPGNTRKEINWAGNSKDYKLTLRLEPDGKDILNDTTHKLTFENNEEDVRKIHQKNYTGTQKLDATTLYGEVYAGRVPEAELTGLKLSDYKMMLLDEFNQSENFSLNELAKISSLDSLYTACVSGATKTEISTALDRLTNTYAKGVLMKLISSKQYMQISATYTDIKKSIEVVPVAYREMDLSNMKIVDGKATNITTKDWVNITTKELSSIKSTDTELAKLDTIDWKPGTIVKYKYSYTLPSGSQTTTAKYISDNINTIFKSNLIDTSNSKNIEGGIRNILFNFMLVPTLKTNGTVQNEAINKYDTNTKNNWVSGYTDVGDGGNLKITETKVYAADSNKEIKGTWTENGGVRTLVISRNSISFLLDDTGKYKEDLQITLNTNYTNDFQIPMVHKSKAQSNLSITNTFYPLVRVDKSTTYDTNTGTEGDMNFLYNTNKNNTNGLVIPLTKVSINDLTGQSVEILIACTNPRCASDNMISGDWEKVIIRIQEGELDNAVKDIIILDSNKEIGINNENDANYYEPQSLLVNNKLVNNVLIRTKVQRLNGSREEDKGELHLKLYYNVGGATVEESRIIKTTDKVLKQEGDYTYFDTTLTSSGLGLTNLTITAGYRNDPTCACYDREDINLGNNTRTEIWGLGVDIVVNQTYYPSGNVATVPQNKTTTDKFGFGVRASIAMNVDDKEIDLSGGVPCNVRVYLLNNTTKAKVQAETISGVDSNVKNSGIGSLNLHGNAPITISANFNNLQLTEGGYSLIVEVEPKNSNSIKEINPFKPYPQKTNNRDITQFNVGKTSINPDNNVCKNSNTGNKWTINFSWYNRENSSPTSYGYEYINEKGQTIRVCSCRCNNESGSDDYKTNKKEFYEKHYIKIFVWSKAKNKTTDITNSSITIHNGDSFRVYVKTYHESNRNDLPLSPSGRKPFSNTSVSCSYGSLSNCNYLRRTPDAVSNINGPSQIQYSINGTVGYNIKNQLMTGELNSLNEVNKIYTFNILPEIFIPLSNRKQTINISVTSKEYNGYIYDNNYNKPLCTSVNAKVNIDSISTTVGGENQDNESIDNSETGIE